MKVPDRTSIVVLVALSAAMTAGGLCPASGADQTHRYRHHYRHASHETFAGDQRCPRYEPSDYKPRVGFEPGCYAARPYGLSNTLYDYSLEARQHDADEARF